MTMTEIGAEALSGKEEYISVKLFKEVDYKRKVTGRGEQIMVYDPKADMSTPPHWEHNERSKEATGDVPAGYKVTVINATVRFTRE